MGTIRQFEDIIAWQNARELVKEVYLATSEGQFVKDYGLKDQIRRSAVSVISNIAEGFERNGDKEFIQYLYYAKGSVGEFRTQLYVASDLNYLTEETFQKLWNMATRTGELISGLIRYLKKSGLKGTKYK